MYVLGIDGGGTNTTGVIANATGEILAKGVVGSSNLNSTSREYVVGELTSLFNKLKENEIVFSKIGMVFAGMAGVRDAATKLEMENVIQSALGSAIKVVVDTDAITALYSGTLGNPGIVQIAGTGAITYGENNAGNRGRVGGWGHLFSDHGSGYSIGRDGLDAAFKAFDGVRKPTLIETLLLEHFQARTLSDIIQDIYRDINPKKKIASLSKLVVQAAGLGDKAAIDIIDVNGNHLGESIATLISRLFGSDYEEIVPIVLTGGIFNLYDLLKESIENVIPDTMHVDIILPQVVPVSGAVIAGYKHENINVNETFIETFHKAY